MDTLQGEEKKREETKKMKSPFSRFLSRSSSEKKKPAKNENRKLKEKQSRSLYDHSTTTSNISDIPIVAGNSGTTATEVNSPSNISNGRRKGLAEKSESDREVVKKILKDVIKQENMDAITL